jgi:peptidoglycan/LPS O-acetylase OafA/YrhL
MFERFWTTVTRAAWMPLVPIGLVVCSVAYGAGNDTYRYAVGYAVDPVLIAIAIVQIIASITTPLWRWLDSRPLSWMGRLSYSLYLFQAIGLGPYVLPGEPTWLRFVVCNTLTFLMAAASYYVIERPFLRLKDRRPPPPEVALEAEPA